MFRYDLTEEQTKQMQTVLHAGLKHIANTMDLSMTLQANQAIKTILECVQVIEEEKQEVENSHGNT